MVANASYVNELFNIKTALPQEYFGHFSLNITSWAAADVCLYFHSHMSLHVLCCQSYLGNLLVRYSSVTRGSFRIDPFIYRFCTDFANK